MSNLGDRNFLIGTSPMIREIFDYWEGLRGPRPMPTRQEFDPIDIPRHLPGLLFIEVEGIDENGAGIYRYRVVGTTEVENRRHNPTGRLVTEGFFGESLEASIADYEWVRVNRTCFYAPLEFVTEDFRPIRELSILLPFGTPDGEVTHILVYSERTEEPLT